MASKSNHAMMSGSTRTLATFAPKSQTVVNADQPSSTSESLARRETRAIGILRIAVLALLVLTAAILATGVYHYTRNAENEKFVHHFEDGANQVVQSFHEIVERNIGAVATLSSTITSHARHHSNSNSSSSFVTLPDFEVLGNHLRIQSGSHVVHYMPVVTDETRPAWEEYALQHRSHIDESYQLDLFYRSRQDTEFGMNQEGQRKLQEQQQQQEEPLPTTILEDGTGYHPKIWRSGAVKPPGDEPEGGGPYSPLWQRSPISKKKQGPINQNLANSKVLKDGLLDTIIHEKKVIMSEASTPTPKILERRAANLRISQYREQVDEYLNGLSTFFVYPVFDSF